MSKSKLYKVNDCKLTISEKWCASFLVTFPVSYKYNGGIFIDGEHYEGYEVTKPKVPDGFELKSIGCGLQLNAHPPYATQYLKPLNGQKVKKSELKILLT